MGRDLASHNGLSTDSRPTPQALEDRVMQLNVFGFSEARWSAAEVGAAAMIAAVRSPSGMIAYADMVSRVSAIQFRARDSRSTDCSQRFRATKATQHEAY
jgi:hypothetical protein